MDWSKVDLSEEDEAEPLDEFNPKLGLPSPGMVGLFLILATFKLGSLVLVVWLIALLFGWA